MLSKGNIKARLKFARANKDKVHDFWNVLWTDDCKTELFGHLNRRPNTAFQDKNLIPTVKHGGGSGVGMLCCIMNYTVCLRVIAERVKQLKLKRNCQSPDFYPTKM